MNVTRRREKKNRLRQPTPDDVHDGRDVRLVTNERRQLKDPDMLNSIKNRLERIARVCTAFYLKHWKWLITTVVTVLLAFLGK